MRESIKDPFLPIDKSRKLLDEYRPKIKIDEHNLEQELIRHPDLGREINDELKLAISYRDEAKRDLEEEEAQFDKDFRADSPDGKRVTDTQVKAEATLDTKIGLMKRDMISWNLLIGYWENLSQAAKDRGYMLTKLVELYMSDYFGDVTGRGERAAARDRLAGEARAIERKRRGA